jgi:hypothetical protein
MEKAGKSKSLLEHPQEFGLFLKISFLNHILSSLSGKIDP